MREKESGREWGEGSGGSEVAAGKAIMSNWVWSTAYRSVVEIICVC